MRSLACVLLLACCLLAASAAPAPPRAVPLTWLNSFDQGLQQSHIQQRPMLLEVTTSWSTLAKAMRHTTWQHESVRTLAQRFILVRVDAERDPYVANHWHVDGYPTYLAIYQGNELGRDVGVVPPAEMVQMLNTSLAKWAALRFNASP